MPKILVTGASEGLGLEICKKFLSQGWQVVGVSRHKPDIDIEYIEADLTDEANLTNVIDIVKEKHPDINVLVNCAGVIDVQSLENIDYSKTENLFKLNVLAPMMLVSRLKSVILNNEADIVNVGSTVGFKAYDSQAAYGASKWALRGFNENLRLEFKGTKVRVFSFNPGGFKSRLFEKATGTQVDLSQYMDPKYLAELLFYVVNLPKGIEVSEMVINRK